MRISALLKENYILDRSQSGHGAACHSAEMIISRIIIVLYFLISADFYLHLTLLFVIQLNFSYSGFSCFSLV